MKHEKFINSKFHKDYSQNEVSVVFDDMTTLGLQVTHKHEGCHIQTQNKKHWILANSQIFHKRLQYTMIQEENFNMCKTFE